MCRFMSHVLTLVNAHEEKQATEVTGGVILQGFPLTARMKEICYQILHVHLFPEFYHISEMLDKKR